MPISSVAEAAERYVIITTSGPPQDWRLILCCIAWKTTGRGQALGLFATVNALQEQSEFNPSILLVGARLASVLNKCNTYDRDNLHPQTKRSATVCFASTFPFKSCRNRFIRCPFRIVTTFYFEHTTASTLNSQARDQYPVLCLRGTHCACCPCVPLQASCLTQLSSSSWLC